MGRRGRVGAIVLAAGLLLLAATVWAAAVPSDLSLAGLHGGRLTSADLAGGPVILVVWASWSPRCRDIVERTNAIQESWGTRARVASIDFQEEPAVVEQFLRGSDLRVPVYLDRDGEFSKSIEVTALPGLVVFKAGELRFRGRLPADVESVLIDALR